MCFPLWSLHQVTARIIHVSQHKMLDCKYVIHILQVHLDVSCQGSHYQRGGSLGGRGSAIGSLGGEAQLSLSSPCRRLRLPRLMLESQLHHFSCWETMFWPSSVFALSRAVRSKHIAAPSCLWSSTTSAERLHAWSSCAPQHSACEQSRFALPILATHSIWTKLISRVFLFNAV